MKMRRRFVVGAAGFVVALILALGGAPRRGAADVPDVKWPVAGDASGVKLSAKMNELAALIGKIESRKLDASYARSSLVLARDFVQYAKDDIANGRPGRAAYVRGYLDSELDGAIADAKALLANPKLNRPVPRPALKNIKIKNGAFFSGRTEVMFGGLGHFGKVREDTPKFSDYGFNLIQIEIGPNSVITGPNASDVKTDAIKNSILNALDNAEKHGVMVNLLLSPHYFPQWALDKYPELKQCGQGFIKYCVSDPNAREVLRRFLEVLIPLVKDKPALQSYTLANEPEFNERSDAAMRGFHEFLKKKYGGIAGLNKAWRKRFKSFDQIKLTEDFLSVTVPARYDWVSYHYRFGTDFFAWMASEIRTMDKRTPMHIKFMDSMFTSYETIWGVDREALEKTTDISGNDSSVYPASGEYALDYRKNASFFDFLKSMKPDAPIQNSENHIIRDDSPEFYSSAEIRAELLIQYLHGMGASTIWVWERGDGESLGNNILSRPNCAAAAARVTLDVRRLAAETTALANASTPVALYYSQASRILELDFEEKWHAAYELLVYQGLPVRMVTDTNVEKGLDPKIIRVLVLPEYIYTTDALYKKLVDFVKRGGRVITLGHCFRMNELDRARNPFEWNDLKCAAGKKSGCVEALPSITRTTKQKDFVLMSELMYGRFGVARPELSVTGGDGKPLLGIEYRSARIGKSRVAFIINALSAPAEIRLNDRRGAWRTRDDILGRRKITAKLRLDPLEIVMFYF